MIISYDKFIRCNISEWACISWNLGKRSYNSSTGHTEPEKNVSGGHVRKKGRMRDEEGSAKSHTRCNKDQKEFLGQPTRFVFRMFYLSTPRRFSSTFIYSTRCNGECNIVFHHTRSPRGLWEGRKDSFHLFPSRFSFIFISLSPLLTRLLW